MEMKQEPDSSDEGVWIDVPPLDVSLDIKAEASDPCEGPSGRQTTPDYSVDVRIPDIKEECTRKSRPAPENGSQLTSDNIRENSRFKSKNTRKWRFSNESSGDDSTNLKNARSPVAQVQLSSCKINTKQNQHKAIPCEESKKTLSKISTVRPKKVYTEKGTFICEQCKNTFAQKAYLLTHMRTHTGEKPFACKECKEKFSVKSSLSRHMRIHTGEKTFGCEECKKNFGQRSNLLIHMTTHTGAKPFACEECKKTFSRRSYLSRHLKRHTGEKPFACEECNRAFGQRSHLLIHMTTHRGDKQFTCEECKKIYSKKNSLSAHMRSHSSEKRKKIFS